MAEVTHWLSTMRTMRPSPGSLHRLAPRWTTCVEIKVMMDVSPTHRTQWNVRSRGESTVRSGSPREKETPQSMSVGTPPSVASQTRARTYAGLSPTRTGRTDTIPADIP